jgi:hypothetical protein
MPAIIAASLTIRATTSTLAGGDADDLFRGA